MWVEGLGFRFRVPPALGRECGTPASWCTARTTEPLHAASNSDCRDIKVVSDILANQLCFSWRCALIANVNILIAQQGAPWQFELPTRGVHFEGFRVLGGSLLGV